MIGNVKYGDWTFRDDGSFEIYVKEILPREVLTILLNCRHWRARVSREDQDGRTIFPTRLSSQVVYYGEWWQPSGEE
jgi:hypothetical protein